MAAVSAALAGELADASAPAADLGMGGESADEGAGEAVEDEAAEGESAAGAASDAADAGHGRPLVALVDSGVPEGSGVESAFSAVEGGSPWEGGGHGAAMLGAIRSEDPEARVMGARALGADGRGTAATVYAAVTRAADGGADVLNLSFAGYAVESNSAVAEAVAYARSLGCEVVAAAGNQGMDASLFTPAGLPGVFTAGAASEGGSRLPSSNYGEAVDAYVIAQSTSYAAARATGWLSANYAPGWRSAILDSPIAAPQAGDAADGGGLVASAAERVRAALPESGVQAAGSLISDDMSGWANNVSGRWSSSYSNGVNTLNLTTYYNYEYYYIEVPVEKDTDYVLSYEYLINSAYSVDAQYAPCGGLGIFVGTHVPAASGVYPKGDMLAGSSETVWPTSPTSDYKRVDLAFNTGSATTVYVFLNGDAVSDYHTYNSFASVRNLGLYPPVSPDMSEWTNSVSGRWSSSYSGGVNTLSLTTHGGFEHYYIEIAVKENTDYLFSYEYLINSAYSVDAQYALYGGLGMRVGTAAPTASMYSTGDMLAGFSEAVWPTSPTSDYKRVDLAFNTGSATTVYVFLDGGAVSDYRTFSSFASVRNLRLSIAGNGPTVTFMNGSAEMGTQEVESGVETALSAVSTLSNRTVPGYSFAYWAEASGSSDKYRDDGGKVTLTADKTLYAVFSRAVAFSANYSGGADPASATQRYNGGNLPVTLPAGPSGRCGAVRLRLSITWSEQGVNVHSSC